MNDTAKSKSYQIRCLLPIGTTVGWVLGYTLGHITVISAIAALLGLVGVISAFTVCPLQLLKFPITCMVKLFKICRAFVPVYGVGDLIAGIIGLILGWMVGLGVIFGIPAAFTLYKYYTTQ